MHEYPITLEMIHIAEDYALRYKAKKVLQINLVIGEECGFAGDAIEMYFEAIAKGTLCEGACINVEYIEAKLECSCCKEIFKKENFSFRCPLCNEMGRVTCVGKEFYVKSIEVEI